MMRIGHGFDVHRLVLDRPLILGGVTIPYEYGPPPNNPARSGDLKIGN